MRVLSPNMAAIVLIAIGLALPTGAVVGDHVGDDGGIVLEPHSGPNGRYASLDGSGNLTIDLGDQLNPDAVTTFDGIFNISNTGSNDVRVWISHNATQYVEFQTADSGPIEGNGTLISPGETVTVDVIVDTHGATPGTRLIDEIEVHATRAGPTSPPTQTGSGSGSGSGGSGSSGGPRSAPTAMSGEPEDRTLVGSGTVRVQFDSTVRPGERVHVERMGGLPPDPPAEGVVAVATHVNGDSTSDASPIPEDRLEELGVDAVVTADEPIVLSGRRSRFGSAGSIDDRRRTVGVYDITPPPRLRDDWATIWITVNRSRFGGDDPSNARVARLTGEGWQLLETRLAQANATSLVFRSRTPGFSTFAVFEDPDVTYRWTFENESAIAAADVGVTYDEPGTYTGRLAVTDALGRSDETTYRLLVNDRPEVRVEAPGTIEPGERVTLRANVTDTYGNTSVTWSFDDGTTAEGSTVRRSFDEGEHVATVRVTDEFGASGEARARLVAGGGDPVVRVVEFALGVEGRLALVALLALFVTGTIRWVADRAGIGAGRRRSR